MEEPDPEKDIGTWTKDKASFVRRSPRKKALSEEEKKEARRSVLLVS